MIGRKIVKEFIKIIVILVLVLAAFAVWQDNRGDYDGKTVVSKKHIAGTEHSAVILQDKDKNDLPMYFLTLDQTHSDQIALIGFEDNIEFCTLPDSIKSTSPQLICLWGDVGVHSKNLQTYRYEGGRLLGVEFKRDSQIDTNMTSDVPDFRFSSDSTGSVIFQVLDRDYDRNPLIDAISSSYRLDGDRFLFDRESPFTYNTSR